MADADKKLAKNMRPKKKKKKKAYGSDTKRSAYKPGGSMTQRKSPGGLNLTFGQAQDGGIMSSPGGAGKKKSAFDDLIDMERKRGK